MAKYDNNPLAYVAESPIHGRGLFARKKIKAETLIGIYEGPATQPHAALISACASAVAAST